MAVATMLLPSVWYRTVTMEPTATLASFCVDPFTENVMSLPPLPLVITNVLASIDFTVPEVEWVATFAVDLAADLVCAFGVATAHVAHAATRATAEMNFRIRFTLLDDLFKS